MARSYSNGPRRPDPVIISPTVRHRRLARLLRRYRGQTGLTLEDVAQRLGWSRAKMSRIEAARIHLSAEDAVELADLYGLPSAGREELITLARQAKQRGWWSIYADILKDDYIGLEAEAFEIRTWETQFIPGLFQTDDYIRALARVALGVPEGDVERRVQVRRTRQALLSRDEPPSLHAIIDEGAFKRPVGGKEAMEGQVDALLTWADRSNVAVQILPYSAGSHQGMEGPFTLLSFDHPIDPDVGFVEGAHGATYLENEADLTRCRLLFEHLSDTALSPEESVEYLSDHLKG